MESFGQRLRREREMRGIKLDEIAAATKIGTRSLKALEDEEFGKLPGGIFNKGFVRSYARFLGINEEQAVSDYLQAAGEPEDKAPVINIEQVVAQQVAEKNAAKPRSRELESINTNTSGFPWTAIVAIVLILAAGSGGWKLYLRHKEQVEARARANAVQTVQQPNPALSQPVLEQPAIPASSDASQQAQMATTSVPQSPALPNSTDTTGAATQSTAGSVSSPTAANASSPEEGFILSVRAKKDAWVSITADGKSVLSALLHASDERSVRAREKIVIKTGNAGGVDIAFNGKLLDAIGGDNEVRRVVINSDGTVR